MEATIERDELVTFRMVTREFHRRFDGFRPGVAKVNALGILSRSNLTEPFGELDHIFVIKIGAGHMNQFSCLILNRGDDVRMAMTRRNDGDAGCEVEEAVAVHILDYRAAASLGDERIAASVGR